MPAVPVLTYIYSQFDALLFSQEPCSPHGIPLGGVGFLGFAI